MGSPAATSKGAEVAMQEGTRMATEGAGGWLQSPIGHMLAQLSVAHSTQALRRTTMASRQRWGQNSQVARQVILLAAFSVLLVVLWRGYAFLLRQLQQQKRLIPLSWTPGHLARRAGAVAASIQSGCSPAKIGGAKGRARIRTRCEQQTGRFTGFGDTRGQSAGALIEQLEGNQKSSVYWFPWW